MSSSEDITNGLALGPAGSRAAPLPQWLGLLTDAACAPPQAPLALLLPETRLAVETVALLCARHLAPGSVSSSDLILDGLKVGSRVRVLPDEGVYGFDGCENGGFWLRLLEQASGRSDGRFWAPARDAIRIEPTVRKRPYGTGNRAGWAKVPPTMWDLFSGSKLGGNAMLARPTVVLIGSQKEFRRATQTLGFAGVVGDPGLAVAGGLPWGVVEDDGELRLVEPAGSLGQPMIVVARDHASARRLAVRADPGSLTFVSARPDDALADRTSVGAIADRHALLIIAPGRLREAFAPIRSDGWQVSELSGSPALSAAATGVPDIDRIAETSAWVGRHPSVMAQASPELEEAFRLLNAFSAAVGEHLEEDDIAEADALLRQCFFEASDWLGAPDAQDLEDLRHAGERLAELTRMIRSVAGATASQAATDLIARLNDFSAHAISAGMTPKGDCVLRLARAAAVAPAYRQALVVGHRRVAVLVERFLSAAGSPMTCVTPGELAGMGPVERVNVLSVMRREAFMRLIDPGAAGQIMFVGYQHEVEIYQRRVRIRQKLIEGLRPDAALLERLPQLRIAAAAPGAPRPDPAAPMEPDPLAIVARPLRRPPPLRPGEQGRPARFCRFSGRSWMALTDDHSVARVVPGADGKAQVHTVLCRDLQNGDLILVRDGADRDIVRDMAEQVLGREIYARQRQDAGYWRRALKGLGLSPEKLRRRLAEEGLDRGLQSLRQWLSDEGPIGPSEPEGSLPMIAAAVGEAFTSPNWQNCLEGVQAVRRAHVHAGFRLTHMLMAECGASILEHSEHETPFELDLGTVWLLEIDQIDTERRDWPYTRINRLTWDSETWKQRLLRRRAPAAENATQALLDTLLEELLAQEEVDAWPE